MDIDMHGYLAVRGFYLVQRSVLDKLNWLGNMDILKIFLEKYRGKTKRKPALLQFL